MCNFFLLLLTFFFFYLTSVLFILRHVCRKKCNEFILDDARRKYATITKNSNNNKMRTKEHGRLLCMCTVTKSVFIHTWICMPAEKSFFLVFSFLFWSTVLDRKSSLDYVYIRVRVSRDGFSFWNVDPKNVSAKQAILAYSTWICFWTVKILIF